MFHDVLPRTDASGGGAERFAVPLDAFESLLDLRVETRREGVSLSRALAAPSARRVALTFDDGTRSHFDHAVPALRARGMSATFFVTTDWIGRPGYMTWNELRQLVAWGMSVQSHSRTHAFLSTLDEASLREELAGSKRVLDAELGQDTDQIALPGGDAPRRALRHLLAESGYRVVAGSRWGTNGAATGGGYIRRCTVRGAPGRELALRMMAGDGALALRRVPREWALAALRSTLGPVRYTRWRGGVLDAFARSTSR